MAFAVYGILSYIACWKWGNWRNWRAYYTTVLYYVIGNLVYVFLFYQRPLWLFSGLFGDSTVLTVAVMVLTYPATAVLFLSKFPDGLRRQALYVLAWAGILLAVEAIDMLLGFRHLNGWTLWHSGVLNLLMFCLLQLHYKKTLWAWPVSAALCAMMIWWFRVPLMKL